MEESREKGEGVWGRTDRHRDGEMRRQRKEGASERLEGSRETDGLREDTKRRKERKKEKREGEGRDITRYPKARGLRISLFLKGILVTFPNTMCNIFFFNLQTPF